MFRGGIGNLLSSMFIRQHAALYSTSLVQTTFQDYTQFSRIWNSAIGVPRDCWWRWIWLWSSMRGTYHLDWPSVWFRTPWTRTWTWTAPWVQVLCSGFGWTKPLGRVHVHRPTEPNLTAWTRTFRVWGQSQFIFKFPTPNQMVCGMSLIMPS